MPLNDDQCANYINARADTHQQVLAETMSYQEAHQLALQAI
jgi:hypothetical protein